MSGTGQAIEPAIEYVRDDVVVSEVHLSGTREGDRIRWEFAGPEDTVWNESKTLIAGQETAVQSSISACCNRMRRSAYGPWTYL